MNPIDVAPAVQALGIHVRAAVFSGATVSNRSNPLERRKKQALEAIRSTEVDSHPVLAAYRELHRLAGADGVLPPAEHLVRLARSSGRLPNINTVVDSYNLVSALTGLSVGAHDLAGVRGDVAFRITDGRERYTPLDGLGPEPVRAGEYACLDDEKILCRLDVKQCRETRITKATAAFLVYVQGNRATSPAEVLSGLRQVGDLIVEICGGAYEIVRG
jgi:methionyl-tRNA synthetase